MGLSSEGKKNTASTKLPVSGREAGVCGRLARTLGAEVGAGGADHGVEGAALVGELQDLLDGLFEAVGARHDGAAVAEVLGDGVEHEAAVDAAVAAAGA